MWGGDTENDNTEINNLDKEINNHKGNMRGNLIWIIVCILLLILVNISSTKYINIIFSILLFGNVIMFFVNRNKKTKLEMREMAIKWRNKLNQQKKEAKNINLK